MEKRNKEASALRTFFGEQWNYLLGLIQERQRFDDSTVEQKQQLTEAVEHIVDIVDSRIRGVGRYRNKLRCSVRDLLFYVQNMIDELPEALELDNNSYIDEPLINSIFSSSNELKILLSQSEEICNFIQPSVLDESSHIYALLFSIMEQKTIFGNEIRAELIQRDIPQTAIHFHEHKIVAPTLNEHDLRSSLKRILFESAVASIRSNMVKLRHSQVQDEKQLSTLHPEQNINNPEVYLKLLVEQLSMPASVIALQSNTINVSKMGILLPKESGQSSNKLQLYELAMEGNYSQVVTLIKFKWGEWLR
ncbi:MAG TPA: hypothetical protein ENH92_00240 [Ectothiorhodospiraceae bacterium]|nr:hypothetical protein [Ectothiorhodospiraceae bacterium]